MGKQVKGLLIHNFYLNKRMILVYAVVVVLISKYLIRDYIENGTKELILASNIYGFTMAYLLGLFAVKLYDAKKDQKWSWFLSTINQGRRAAIQAKFITDAVFILIDFLLMGLIITGVLLKFNIKPSLLCYIGLMMAIFVVLITSSIDNLVYFLDCTQTKKVLIYIIVTLLIFLYAYLIMGGKIGSIKIKSAIIRESATITSVFVGIIINLVTKNVIITRMKLDE